MVNEERKIEWVTMLIPFAIVIALMAVFMIMPDESKSIVDTMRGFFGDTIGIYYPKFCPECGRPLDEYKIGEKGANYESKRNDYVYRTYG